MKKKIRIVYEITFTTAVDLEVEEQDLADLMNTRDLNTLKEYDIGDEELWEQAMDGGYTESDWCIVDEKDKVIIPYEISSHMYGQ